MSNLGLGFFKIKFNLGFSFTILVYVQTLKNGLFFTSVSNLAKNHDFAELFPIVMNPFRLPVYNL